jgi:hypothetical protein
VIHYDNTNQGFTGLSIRNKTIHILGRIIFNVTPDDGITCLNVLSQSIVLFVELNQMNPSYPLRVIERMRFEDFDSMD